MNSVEILREVFDDFNKIFSGRKLMSYSVNDKYYELRWSASEGLSPADKISLLLGKNIITIDDVEDEVFTDNELTEMLYDSPVTVSEMERV